MNKIPIIRFNATECCFTYATESGVRIYQAFPVRLLKTLNVDITGSIKICGMVGTVENLSILWWVCGGENPKYPDNCVNFFDLQKEEMSPQLKCPSTVTGVTMKKDKVVVSLAKALIIFTYPGLETLTQVDLNDNSKGLLQLTPSSDCDREILIFGGQGVGSLGIMDIKNIQPTTPATIVSIKCHNSELSCIALNVNGTRAATTSDTDTIIRVFDTVSNTLLLEFTQLCYSGAVCSLTIDKASRYLCVLRDNGYFEFFPMRVRQTRHSWLGGLILNWLGLGWKSFARFTLEKKCGGVCVFGIPNTFTIVTFDKTYVRYIFAANDPFKHPDRAGGVIEIRKIDHVREDDYYPKMLHASSNVTFGSQLSSLLDSLTRRY